MAERRTGEKGSQQCWDPLSTAEKVLLFLLISALTLLVALFIYTSILLLNSNGTCVSYNCIKTSANILESIDPDVNPCEDFSKFACQKYQAQDLEEEIKLRKLDLISEEVSEEDGISVVTAKRFYQSCINTTAIEEEGEDTLSSLVEDLGGWPLVLGQNWNEASFNWLEFMAKLRILGLPSDFFLYLNYSRDYENGSYLRLEAPPLAVPFTNNLIYIESMVKVAIKLGSSVEIAWKEMRKVRDFEADLSTIRQRAMEDRPRNKKMTVEMLNSIWPTVNLVEVLNSLTQGYFVLDKKSLVAIPNENYIFSELNGLLMKTPRRTQANYIIWKVIEGLLPYSTDEFKGIYEEFAGPEEREENCFDETIRRFSGVVETLYLQEYINNENLDDLKVILSSIKDSLVDGEEPTVDDEVLPFQVVIMGLEGENSGITELDFESNNILKMVNQVQFKVENDYYSCLNKNDTDCHKLGYYSESKEVETYFDSSSNTLYLSLTLLAKWYDPNDPHYITFGKIGQLVAGIIQQTHSSPENLPQISAIDATFEGYLTWVQENGVEKKLPGLQYSPKQLFWVGGLSIHCNNIDFTNISQSQYFNEEFACAV